MKPAYLIILIVFNVFWASSLAAYKLLEPHLHYASIVTLRFGTAAVGLALLWPLLPGKAPRGRDLAKTFLMGAIVFVLGHRLQVLGNQLGTAGNSAVLMSLEPVLTSIAAALFLREHIGPRRWIGFTLGLIGVALLNRVWSPEFKWTSLTASGIFVSSFLCEAAYSVMGKPLIERAGMFKVLALALLGGTALNLALEWRHVFSAVQVMPLSAWLLVLYLGILCTLIGYGIWFVVIRETDVNVTALTIFVQPIAGVPIAALVLHEPLHLGQLWGSLAIVAGLVIALSRQVHREPHS
jgi:drug/metabolite transporter (DMT)-like permease